MTVHIPRMNPPTKGRRAGYSYFGPGGPGIKDLGAVHQAARQQEGEWTHWYALECAVADPETFEPIKAHLPVNLYRAPAEDRSGITKSMVTRGRDAEILPDFAVVRTGPQTAQVVHIPSGKVITAEMPIKEACAEQRRITGASAQWVA